MPSDECPMKPLLKPLIALLLAGLAASPAIAGGQRVYLGSVAMDAPMEMVRRLTPLTHYLSEKTGLDVSFRASHDMNMAVSDLGNDYTQIAYLTPVAYLDAHRKYNAKAVVAPLVDGKSTFRLVVVVREDSAIRSMRDLKGKSFAFGDKSAILQRAVVVGGGIKLEELEHYDFINYYDNIAKAVLNRDFDAGILKESAANEYRTKGLRIIHVSPPLPSYLFAVNARLPKETVARLRDALLALKADTPEHRAILEELDRSYDGFAEISDGNYDIVRKLVAPFQ